MAELPKKQAQQSRDGPEKRGQEDVTREFSGAEVSDFELARDEQGTMDRLALGLPNQPAGAPVKHKNLSGLLDANAVALFINNGHIPLIIHVLQRVSLGRYSSRNTLQPDIDLAPYGAYQYGVSRMHAAIHLDKDNALVVEDLGSSNGSMLNGTRLDPFVPVLLKSGDHVRLAELDIEMFFEHK
jgi:hypothetical protein